MEFQRLEALKAEIGKASPAQVLDLQDIIQAVISEQVAAISLARRTQATIQSKTCPHCRGVDVVLHGKDKNGRQRFRCRAVGCGRTFNILTGTPMARARKPEKWGRYLSCMTDHLSIRRIIASGIGVHPVTAWRWRHRFLKAAVNDNAGVLSGVIEADETFFVRSFKGDRGWTKRRPPEDRAARPSAWGATKRGLSHEQVPVLTAVDNAGGVYESILTSRYAIAPALEGHIAAGSVLCSDGQKDYVKAAVIAGAEHRRVIVQTVTPNATKAEPKPTKRRQKGRLGLGRVNAHHGRLKVLINGRCRGVATKYLGNYLGWHRAMLRHGFEGKNLLDRALA
jgi:transposase-like protein